MKAHAPEPWRPKAVVTKITRVRRLKCVQHDGYPADLVCVEKNCPQKGSLLCFMCKEFGPKHKGHDVDLVVNVSPEMRKEVSQRCELLKKEERRVAEAMMSIDRIESDIGWDDEGEYRGELSKTLGEVDDYFTSLITELEKRRNELKNALVNVSQEKVDSLRTQKDQLRKFLVRTYESLCMAEEVLDLEDQQLVSEALGAVGQVEMVLAKQRRCTQPITLSDLPLKLDADFTRKCSTLGTVSSFDKELALSKLEDPNSSLPSTQTFSRQVDYPTVRPPLRSSPNSKCIVLGNGNGPLNGQFSFSYGLAVDSRGRLLVADTHNHRIQVLDDNGVFVQKFGTSGTENGQFSYPSSVAVGVDDRIIVTEDGNHRVQVFDESGTFLFGFGGNGSTDGKFMNPYGVAVDKELGHIIVSDYSNNRIQVFDDSGAFLFKFGGAGQGDGKFNGPTGVAVDSNHHILVSDHNNNRMQTFDENGNFLFRFGEGKLVRPWGVAVDDSHIIVAECGNHRIFVFKKDGTALWTFGSRGSEEGQFIGPLGVGIDFKGRIVVADNYNHRLQILD